MCVDQLKMYAYHSDSMSMSEFLTWKLLRMLWSIHTINHSFVGSFINLLSWIPCKNKTFPTIFSSPISWQVRVDLRYTVHRNKTIFLRFVFEKTFPTCMTLEHLQGALNADNVYMELLQVTWTGKSHSLFHLFGGFLNTVILLCF